MMMMVDTRQTVLNLKFFLHLFIVICNTQRSSHLSQFLRAYVFAASPCTECDRF